jgi:hypothetical protein
MSGHLKTRFDAELDRFVSVPNEYMFRVRHSRKQRLLLNALKSQHDTLTDPAEIKSSEDMIVYLDKLLSSRVYASPN